MYSYLGRIHANNIDSRKPIEVGDFLVLRSC